MYLNTLFALPLLSVVLHSTASPLPGSIFGRPNKNATFDYIVIGGGTAGLVVATRLSQASKSVAVIEAGGFYEEDVGNISTVPAYAVYGAGASPDDVLPGVDWGFVTDPQAGMNNRKLHYARGKTLGGSSARNYFTYQRPTVDSLGRWASIVGDSSYQFESFLPYFKKSVDYSLPDNDARPSNASVPTAAGAFAPGSGPLHVSFAIWANSFSSFVNLAWQKLGVPVAEDFVSGKLSGVQYSMNTINPNGQIRDTSYSSFLRSVVDKAPIQVYNNTLAKQILFEKNVATGALVNSGGVNYILSAEKEVILSAGVFQSPQLLMVSGVGPVDTLNKFNITIVSALEGVGQNMEDHLLFGASYEVKTLTHSAVDNGLYRASAIEKYNEDGTGMLSNPGGEILAWEKLPSMRLNALSTSTRNVLASYPEDWPVIEHLALDAYSGNNQNYIKDAPQTPFMYASPAAGIMVPQSRGNVTITSRDTAVHPVINPNWLTHPADQELAVAAFRRMREMMDTDVMKGIWVEEVVPGRDIDSDADILNAIRQNGIQLFHASVTCKMGQSSDPAAVVDNRGRVFGTQRLRVIDASALPFLPPGHPQAVIYALAEKLSDDILQS